MRNLPIACPKNPPKPKTTSAPVAVSTDIPLS